MTLRSYSPEKILLQHCHGRNDPWFPSGMKSMQLHIGANHRSREFCISSGTRTTTTDILCYVVNLLW